MNVLLCLWLVAAPADAVVVPAGDDGLYTVDPLVAAETAYAALDFEQARTAVVVALADPNLSVRDQVRAHLLGGQIAVVLDKDAEARGHFVWALQHDPLARLPLDAPPKTRQFFDGVQAEIATESAPVTPPTLAPAAPVDEATAAATAPAPPDPVMAAATGVVGGTCAAVGLGAGCGVCGFCGAVGGSLLAPPALLGVYALGSFFGGYGLGPSLVPVLLATGVGSVVFAAAFITGGVLHSYGVVDYTVVPVAGVAGGLVGGGLGGLLYWLLLPPAQDTPTTAAHHADPGAAPAHPPTIATRASAPSSPD